MSEDGYDAGTPGGSLLRTYEQRRRAREDRVRQRFPRTGGLLLALGAEPASTTAFRSGALGEVAVAEVLARRCGPAASLLYNRRLGPRRRDGDIDVLAVTPSGVHVVDVKRYAEATVRVRRSGGLLSPVTETLLVGGRDRSRLVESVSRQREAVEDALQGLPGGGDDVAVHAALCFVGADLPLFAARVDGVRLLGPRGAARRLDSGGPLTPDVTALVARHLADRLPPA